VQIAVLQGDSDALAAGATDSTGGIAAAASPANMLRTINAPHGYQGFTVRPFVFATVWIIGLFGRTAVKRPTIAGLSLYPARCRLSE